MIYSIDSSVVPMHGICSIAATADGRLAAQQDRLPGGILQRGAAYRAMSGRGREGACLGRDEDLVAWHGACAVGDRRPDLGLIVVAPRRVDAAAADAQPRFDPRLLERVVGEPRAVGDGAIVDDRHHHPRGDGHWLERRAPGGRAAAGDV